ncbi:MAG: hypothetical protein HY299_18085 [Verrucomicrobia bacterium]|nr:hypothetical protein [Verrucomicrobiota bacterium]
MKRVLIVLLTLLWVAASNHCRLESIPSLQFFACSDHAQNDSHHDTSNDTDGCAFETQLYKAETAQVSLPAPVLLSTASLVPKWADLSALRSSTPILPDDAPMELSRVWQFSCRAALPPRAPSLLS